jgi:Ca2+-binding EF-hand superfamily protein
MAAPQMTDKQHSDAKEMFIRLDTDRRQCLKYSQVHQALQGLGLEIQAS